MKVPVPDVLLPAEELGRVHFVGIGGAGLSAIARIMAARGLPVTGSDDQDTPFLPSLRELDVTCHLGYAAEHVGDADTVVVTTAARDDNPEVAEARRRGLRMLPRSAGLWSVMAGRQVVAVAGTHGKTTTTAMLTSALLAAGADPSYAVGGILATGRNADAGSGDLFVAEADESDGAFLVYRPFAAIVTNVAADHLDVWGTEEAYRAAFADFVDTVDPAGFLVLCADDPGSAALASRAEARALDVVTYGEAGADLRVAGLRVDAGGTSFDVEVDGVVQARVSLRVPGRHYALDAAAALCAGLRLGYYFEDLRAGLESFVGSGRRMEAKGEVAGVRVYDSYAHHPAEIAADLEAARAVAGDGRVVVAFQPHLVSRTRIFGPAMGEALGAADEVVVLDVYLARETRGPCGDRSPGRGRRTPAARTGGSGGRPRGGGHRAGGPRPARRPGAHPRRRHRDRGRPAGARPPGSRGVTSLRRREDATSSAERTALRSRKRFTRRQWRRRWLAWRYVVASILLLALVAGSIWLVYFSTVLTVKRVDVEGETSLTRAQILAQANVPEGEQLARLDIDAIANRLRSVAAIRTVDVSRKWPDAVRIIVEERVAIAVIDIGGRLRGLDADGVVFNEYAKPPPGLPRVSSTTQTTPEALKEAATVIAALPQRLRRLVDHVEVLTVDQITLVLRDGRTVVWGSSDDSRQKAEVLLALLDQPAQIYDVSVPSQPTTRN